MTTIHTKRLKRAHFILEVNMTNIPNKAVVRSYIYAYNMGRSKAAASRVWSILKVTEVSLTFSIIKLEETT